MWQTFVSFLCELANQTCKLKVHQVRYLILDEADYLPQAEHEGAIHQD